MCVCNDIATSETTIANFAFKIYALNQEIFMLNKPSMIQNM
jgi:hypothetical protein